MLVGCKVALWCCCRHREQLAQAAFAAFKGNAGPFWAGQQAAELLHAALSKASFRQKFVAWQRWAERGAVLRERLKLASVACRRTILVAGQALL